MQVHEYRNQFDTEVERLAAAIARDLAAPVPACPGWTTATLANHVAGVFRFATANLLAGPDEPMQRPQDRVDDPPLDDLTRSAAALADAFDATDPDAPRPNWAGAPTAAFWWRRMAHETAVHRVDAQAAVGTVEPIDRALAVDGIEELIDTFLVHAGPRGIVGNGETVHLHATDVDDGGAGEWTFTFHPDGVDVVRSHAKGDLAGRATASDLCLLVWNREPVELTSFGDVDLRTWWAEHVRI